MKIFQPHIQAKTQVGRNSYTTLSVAIPLAILQQAISKACVVYVGDLL